jgi:5'-3' exonuclease
MNQPIRRKIIETHDIKPKPFYTLIVDGNNLFKIAISADKRVNRNGDEVGGIFQFLLQLKIMLSKRDFEHCYVMWDGNQSGQLRYQIYQDYKANRDKHYELKSESDYDKNINDFVKRTMAFYNGKNVKEIDNTKYKETEEECFDRQKEIVMKCLEELFIRQVISDEVEGDDLIAYYVNHKKNNEKIIIMSGDRDLTQLIADDVCVYVPSLKMGIVPENHVSVMGYRHENVLLKKMICGDSSDNIKGIKGMGEETFFKLFPEVKEREVTLEEILERSKSLLDERIKNKKKPLKTLENILNRVTTGSQGKDIFEINKKIINLKEPLLTKEAIEQMENIMYAPIDPEGRSIANLYQIIMSADIVDLIDDNRFSTFFSTFNRIIDKEKKYYEKDNK